MNFEPWLIGSTEFYINLRRLIYISTSLLNVYSFNPLIQSFKCLGFWMKRLLSDK